MWQGRFFYTMGVVCGLAGCVSGRMSGDAQPVLGVKTMDGMSLAAKEYDQECGALLASARAALESLQGQAPAESSVDSFLKPLNGLWKTIDRGLNVAGLYRNVHPDAGVRKVADRCEQEFSKIVTDIGLSKPLYQALLALDVSKEDASTQHYVSNMLRDFKRAGVDKDEATREKVRVLKDALVQVGQEFGKNIREDVRTLTLDSVDELKGLPQDYIEKHAPNADGKIVLTTDYPDYLPYMTYASSDERRFEFYKIFRQRGYPKNEAVLKTLLEKRHALATLLGYPHWAAYITEDKMIKSDKAAFDFIQKVATLSSERAQKDYNELLAELHKHNPKAVKVGDWQKAYLEEIVKRDTYSFDSQKVREYFQYDQVKQGLFDITGRMFGVRYVKVNKPVWHPSVEVYELYQGDELVGRFYLDMHPRADKYNHAAAFPMQSGVKGDQIPEASLVCNFPGENEPSALMEHDQVETFFHEFGHLLHHLFAGKQKWVGLSGIATEWDFVEAPSQMLEEWAWDAASLKTFAKNTQGEVLPDSLIASMRKARDFGKGLWVRHQMFYAAVSLNYYNRNPEGLDTTAVMREMQDQYSLFDYVDDTYFQLSFGHLEGYSAIYYTYMWSLVIAKDLLSAFDTKGLLDSSVAGRYREYVLAPGGSKEASALVKDFLGRDYSFDAFGRWLNAQ